MNDFEDLLREELRHREPPAGFAERVMARVPARPPGRVFVMPWRSVAAIAAMLALVFGGLLYQQHREAERAKAANRQLMFALRLAAEKMQRVQQRVQNSSAVVKVDREDVKGEL